MEVTSTRAFYLRAKPGDGEGIDAGQNFIRHLIIERSTAPPAMSCGRTAA
jgi:hypothetical protein